MKIALACSALLTLCAVGIAMPAVAEDSPNVSIGTLYIEGAFTRPTQPGAKYALGYMSIINVGSAPDRLLAVQSDISNKVELHETKIVNGKAETRTLADGIEIPAGATVDLAPGRAHITFLNIKHPVKDGDIIHATLGFENAGRIDIGFHAVQSLEKDSVKDR